MFDDSQFALAAMSTREDFPDVFRRSEPPFSDVSEIAILAEVDRLRADVASLQGALDHARTTEGRTYTLLQVTQLHAQRLEEAGAAMYAELIGLFRCLNPLALGATTDWETLMLTQGDG